MVTAGVRQYQSRTKSWWRCQFSGKNPSPKIKPLLLLSIKNSPSPVLQAGLIRCSRLLRLPSTSLTMKAWTVLVWILRWLRIWGHIGTTFWIKVFVRQDGLLYLSFRPNEVGFWDLDLSNEGTNSNHFSVNIEATCTFSFLSDYRFLDHPHDLGSHLDLDPHLLFQLQVPRLDPHPPPLADPARLSHSWVASRFGCTLIKL